VGHLTAYGERESIAGRHQTARTQGHGAGLDKRHHVEAEDRLGGWVRQHALVDHHRGPAVLAGRWAFFRRLEDEDDRSVHAVPKPHQDLGRTEAHCRVHVVAAGVHDAGIGGAVGDIHLLLDRECVDVGTPRHDRPGQRALEDGNHPVVGHPRPHLIAHGLEPPRDLGARLLFSIRKLGVLVEPATCLDQLWLELARGRGDVVHQRLPGGQRCGRQQEQQQHR
jgi:hypothetical protein